MSLTHWESVKSMYSRRSLVNIDNAENKRQDGNSQQHFWNNFSYIFFQKNGNKDTAKTDNFSNMCIVLLNNDEYFFQIKTHNMVNISRNITKNK